MNKQERIADLEEQIAEFQACLDGYAKLTPEPSVIITDIEKRVQAAIEKDLEEKKAELAKLKGE